MCAYFLIWYAIIPINQHYLGGLNNLFIKIIHLSLNLERKEDKLLNFRGLLL